MYQKCSACNGALEATLIPSATARIGRHQVDVQKCRNCGGIHFTGYLGDSYKVVAHGKLAAEQPGSELTYFDLDTLGSAGRRRIHGWMDEQRRMIQVG